MATLSKRRKTALAADAETVHRLYQGACERFGAEAVGKSLSLVWTLRCMWGVQGVLPFGAMVGKNLGELLYVARDVCGYGNSRKGAL